MSSACHQFQAGTQRNNVAACSLITGLDAVTWHYLSCTDHGTVQPDSTRIEMIRHLKYLVIWWNTCTPRWSSCIVTVSHFARTKNWSENASECKKVVSDISVSSLHCTQHSIDRTWTTRDVNENRHKWSYDHCHTIAMALSCVGINELFSSANNT